MRWFNQHIIWIRANWLTLLDVAKTLMLGILLIMAITLLSHTANQTQQIKNLSEQNHELSLQIQAAQDNLKKDTSDKLNKLQAHIDCIITFFGLSPARRQSQSIENVCHFVPNAVSSKSDSSASIASPSPSHGTSSSASANTTPPAPAPQPNIPQTPLQRAMRNLNSILKRINPLK